MLYWLDSGLYFSTAMSALFSSVRFTASSRLSSSTGLVSGAGEASTLGMGLGEGATSWARAVAQGAARSRTHAARLSRIMSDVTSNDTGRATLSSGRQVGRAPRTATDPRL